MTKQKKMEHHLVESLAEDESLTADLVDEAASVLLDWGLAQAQGLARQAETLPSQEMDARLADLRRTMKRINREAGEAAPEEQAERVRELLEELETAAPHSTVTRNRTCTDR